MFVIRERLYAHTVDYSLIDNMTSKYVIVSCVPRINQMYKLFKGANKCNQIYECDFVT
jgi:hypothetical protein